ncbi:hypothetical protein [Shinella sp. BYT-45]|uniref:hypothetical protein n=1 Tax=Shinella sp. BYT-45 TaxID=3377377 RepID=UPI003980DA7B
MTCTIEAAPAGARHFRKESLWHKLFLVFRRRRRARLARLDPRELSDHMKRDLGFLDGRS